MGELEGKLFKQCKKIYTPTEAIIKGNWINGHKALSIVFEQYNKKTFKNYWSGLNSNGKTAFWNVKFRYNSGEPNWAEVDVFTCKVLKT